METARQKAIVHALYDMELHMNLMEQCVQKITQKMSTLMIRRDIPVPGEKRIDYKDMEIKNSVLYTRLGLGIGIILGLAGGFALGKIFFFQDLLMAAAACIGAMTCGALGGWGGRRIDSRIENEKRRREYERQEGEEAARYQSEKERYEKDSAADEDRIRQEKRIWENLRQQKERLTRKREESADLLQEFYQRAGIRQEYRGLIVMGYMDDLVQMGVNAQLEGLNGLYYLVRTELRQDHIEEIIGGKRRKPEDIFRPGNRLYEDWSRTCRQAERLFWKIWEEAREGQNRFEKSFIITDYIQERTKTEETYREIFWMNE